MSPSGSKKDVSSGLRKEGHPEGVRSVPTPSTSVDSYCGQCEEQRAVLVRVELVQCVACDDSLVKCSL